MIPEGRERNRIRRKTIKKRESMADIKSREKTNYDSFNLE